MDAYVIMKSMKLMTTNILRRNLLNIVRTNSDLCKSGKKQSPIDICTAGAEGIEKSPLKFESHWEDEVKLSMSLVGNILQIKANSNSPMTLEGGVLCGKYNFDQLILKWGESDTNGSEHSLDKERFGMEAQLIYFNSDFKCASEALKTQDGIAILGVFIRASEEKNCDLDSLVNSLGALSESEGESVPIPKNILPMFKNPLEKIYFSYEGSLTVPPCCETIRWLVFQDGVCVHKDQIAAFRQICGPGGQIAKNYRDVQGLNERKIQCVTPK